MFYNQGQVRSGWDLPRTTTLSSSTIWSLARWLYRDRNSEQLTERLSDARRGYGSGQALLISWRRSLNALSGDEDEDEVVLLLLFLILSLLRNRIFLVFWNVFNDRREEYLKLGTTGNPRLYVRDWC